MFNRTDTFYDIGKMINSKLKEMHIERLHTGDLDRVKILIERLDFTNDINYLEQCLRDPSRVVLVARMIDGTDCGIAILNRGPSYPMFRRLNIPEIQDVNVAHSARGQGVGAALIAAAEAAAREKGASQVGIGVGLHAGFGAAQRLYVRLGYVPDGAGIADDEGRSAHPGDIRPIDDALCLWMVKEVLVDR